MTPRTLAAFRGSTLVLPDVRMLEEAERDALRAQVSRGTRLVVTGMDATGLPASEALTRFPECPGRAYLADLEKDFGKADPSQAADFLAALAPDSERPHRSVLVRGDPDRASGREAPHLLRQLQGPGPKAECRSDAGKGHPRQRRRRRATGKAWFLPFLGEAQEVEGQRQDANLVFVLPDVQKGAVVWFEPR